MTVCLSLSGHSDEIRHFIIQQIIVVSHALYSPCTTSFNMKCEIHHIATVRRSNLVYKKTLVATSKDPLLGSSKLNLAQKNAAFSMTCNQRKLQTKRVSLCLT